MNEGCEQARHWLNLHLWIIGCKLHLEASELVNFRVAAHLQPETRRGEVRIVPHLRKINTAVTSFDLQLFAVHTEHFSTRSVSFCSLFFPLGGFGL